MDDKNLSNKYLQATHLQPQHLGFKSTQNLNYELQDPRFLDLDNTEKDGIVQSEEMGREQPVKQERKVTGWRVRPCP